MSILKTDLHLQSSVSVSQLWATVYCISEHTLLGNRKPTGPQRAVEGRYKRTVLQGYNSASWHRLAHVGGRSSFQWGIGDFQGPLRWKYMKMWENRVDRFHSNLFRYSGMETVHLPSFHVKSMSSIWTLRVLIFMAFLSIVETEWLGEVQMNFPGSSNSRVTSKSYTTVFWISLYPRTFTKGTKVAAVSAGINISKGFVVVVFICLVLSSTWIIISLKI